MSNSSLFSGRSYGALMSRLVWPTATLLAVTLAFVFTTIHWTSDSANITAGHRQRMQLTGAVEQRLEDLKGRLVQFAANPGLLGAGLRTAPLDQGEPVAPPPQPFDFTGVFAPGESIALLASRTREGFGDAGAATALLAELVEAARSNLSGDGRETPGEGFVPRDLAVSRLVFDGAAVLAAVAVPITQGTGPHALVVAGYERLGPLKLRRLADLHAIDGLRVSRDPPGDGAFGLEILDGAGNAAAYLTWSPERPGDIMRERLIPLTLFGSLVAIALFSFVIGYIRWIAKDLASSQEHAQNLLGRDPLSGLPNRLLFGERLDGELARLNRSGGGLAVMFLDLDRFKDVNDTYGHQAGDELIKLVARRLEELLRTSDTLARFGGDEFAVIQTGLRAQGDADALARRILDEITHPFEINGTPVSVGVSIGISLAPENGTAREDLMRLADTALYQAKSEGRNRYRFFARQMDETIRMRKTVEDDLRNAIEGDELALHYQPIFSADGQTIVGLEALVRWPHAKQGLISPARFIAIAEERGLVIPLGEWVLRRACQDGRRWPGLRVAVNVSPIQFRHRDFVASVMRVLKETGFEAQRLEIELTEGVVVEDADAAEAAMMELRALGVNLALDDFGTGYSSLIYLRRFAFDKIKIDRSFLESMEATGESAILVHSIVHLGRALGLTVTAEGVETKEQHRFLQALGCHQLQGFLFSKPVPPDEIDRLLGLAGPKSDVAA
ncbi:MAG TPA: EAL domain-containing protein [Beijerinckiaceae bacterium]|jgi:diguanylate cyclase (GGDEF)-like protein